MNRKKNGFTTVELVIVIAVIAILATVLIPTFSGLVGKANDSKALQEAKNAYTDYLIENGGTAPEYMLYDADSRFVALHKGSPKGVYDSQQNAIKAILDDPNTEVDESVKYTSIKTKTEELFSVCINEKVVDLVIFMGQSNMSGRGVASQAPTVSDGCGYEFRAFSDPTKLYPAKEPFGVTENNPNGVNENTPKTGSMVSALMNAYYAERGVPIVGVSCSRGNTNIAYWAPDGKALTDAISRHNTAKKWLEDNGYTIANDFMVWCQGEADANNSAEYYTKCLDAVIDEMMQQAGVKFCAIVRIGNRVADPSKQDVIIRAQTEYCKSSGKAILASAKFAGFGAEKLNPNDGIHLTQAGYNELGADAGKNIAYYINTGKEPTMYDPKFNNTYPIDDLPGFADNLEFTFDSAIENGVDFSKIGTVSNGTLTVTNASNPNGVKLTTPIKISEAESFTIEFVSTKASDKYGSILLSEGASQGYLYLSTFDLRLRNTAKMEISGVLNSETETNHYAIVYNAETKTLKMYVNYQALTISTNNTLSTLGALTFNYLFGGYNQTYEYKGTMHYFRYVNEALTVENFHREA